MRCKQFRALINSALNHRKEVRFSEGMQAHVDGCAACREYARTTIAVDRQLKASARPHVPPEFYKLPDIIIALESSRARRSDWTTPLWQGAKLSIPAAAAWLISPLLPQLGQYGIHVLLIFGASLLFTLSAIRTRMSV